MQSCDPRILVQVPQRTLSKGVPPALPTMLGSVVDHVAPLAESPQIRGCAVARVVIEVSARQRNIGHPHAGKSEASFDSNPLAAVRTPASRLRVPPTTIAEMRNAP